MQRSENRMANLADLQTKAVAQNDDDTVFNLLKSFLSSLYLAATFTEKCRALNWISIYGEGDVFRRS
jgi:hypothetical protein